MNSREPIGAIALVAAAIIFYLACSWRTYTKMGEAGWKSLVPLVATWVLFRHAVGDGRKMLLALIPLAGQIYGLYVLFRWYSGFGFSRTACILFALFPFAGLPAAALTSARWNAS